MPVATRWWRGVAVAAVLVTATACSGSGGGTGNAAAQAATTMRVDADLARYRLDLIPDGGALSITIDDEFESRQMQRVRQFLRTQQRRLSRGDVSGFEELLGTDTPGLAGLAKEPGRLKLAYIDLPAGGRLLIRSDDAPQVAAVHQLLNDVLVRFGGAASVGTNAPATSSTTTAPPAPEGFLG